MKPDISTTEAGAKNPPRIVAFTKDWNDVPTCTTHVLREMGKTLPVLWVGSIGTRRPSLAHAGHAGRILRRLAGAFRRAQWKENNLRVLNPLLVPKAQSAVARALNRVLFRLQARRDLRAMGDGPIEYWCFVPNAVDLLPRREAEGEGGGWKVEGGGGEACPPKPESASAKEGGGLRVEGGGGEGRGMGVRCQSSPSEHRTPNIEHRTSKFRAPFPLRCSMFDVRCWTFMTKLLRPVWRKGVSARSEPFTVHHPLVIYYCVDDWGKFHNLDGAWLEEKERALLARADVVFAASRYLEEKLRKVVSGLPPSSLHPPPSTFGVPPSTVCYMPHGVEYARFRRALDPAGELPADVRDLPRPRIGFYGNLYPWVDFELMRCLAEARPGWSFILIGPEYCDVTLLRRLGNVHLLGRREHERLPDYCRAFDAAIIPYDMTQERMESVNPVKARELLAAGVPIVASDLPELRGMGDGVRLAAGVEGWLTTLERQMKEADRQRISNGVAGDDWSGRVREMRVLMEEGRSAQRMNGDSEWGRGGVPSE